jgi:DnaJ-class molecular chaperone
MAKARAAVYSEDEYDDLSQFQRSRRNKGTMGDEQKYGMGSEDRNAKREFWEDAEARDQPRGRTYYNESKAQYEKKIFDEFDDFFNFTDNVGYDASRDDTKGSDYKADLVIDFLEAVNGVEKEISLNKRIVCHTCKGRRAQNKPRTCFECGGRGSIIGNYSIRKKCPKCDGSGCSFKTSCESCEGIGV